MNRRQFFRSTIPLGLYPLAARGLPFHSLAATSPLLTNPCDVTDKCMVIIFLNGGNDIFNTAVPLDQFSAYANHRPNIHLPESALLTLDASLPDDRQLGLHPGLVGFKNLYDEGLLSVVQRVGYAEPNRSHFKSLENWLTGSGGALENLPSGWAGRFLKNRYPGYAGLPFLGEPDPLGILFGNMDATGFHTADQHRYEINLSGQDPAGFYTLIASLGGEAIANIPDSEHGEMLDHIEAIGSSVNVYAQRISTTFNNGSNSSTTYPANSLGGQLKTIARMLKGGCRTKIFMATTGGFDTHVNMVDPANTILGAHAGLMSGLGSAVKAFQDDLESLGLDDRVMTVVFSEFGRKVIQNASLGLDHGTLSSMFVVGKAVNPGVVGTNVNLSQLDSPGAPDPVQLQHDYRQVFATLLQDWLGAKNSSLLATFQASNFYDTKLPLIKPAEVVPSGCYYTPVAPIACACLQVKVMLEGLLENGQTTMRTDLATAGLLPAAQPYNTAPFNYTGSETASSFPADTVDWLLLELRKADDLSQIVSRKAALLRSDGQVTDTAGLPGVSFAGVPQGIYHLAVMHRTHLAVLSSEPVLTDVPNYLYNFTLSSAKAAGVEQMKLVGASWAMMAGDADGNHVINHKDHNTWAQADGQNNVYSPADLNADGNVDGQDYDLWFANRSKLGQLK